MKNLSIRITFVLSLIAVVPAAQESENPTTTDSTAAVLAGHSYHGEAFNEGPRHGAYLMGDTGDVHFPITTDSEEAQQFFDQGVGQLHGFWYFEAERSFRQVLRIEPECAIAYWGMAMANENNKKRAKELIKNADEKKDSGSEREQMWIKTLADYYAEPEKDKKRDDKKLRREWVRDMEEIIEAFPEDVEAKAFLALQIWKNSRRGHPIPSHMAIDALAKQVLAENPRHPIHHYLIHLWDHEKPARAVFSAARCGQASPAIAHMWHMPGHIFSRLHRYHDAAWQQEASARVDHAHMMRDRVMPDQIHNYAHNNEWLARNLSYLGRVNDATVLAKNMIELPRLAKFRKVDDVEQYDIRGSSYAYGRRRLVETLLRFEMWEDVVSLADTPYLEATNLEEEQLRRNRSLGIAYFNLGQIKHGQKVIEDVDVMLDEMRDKRQSSADQAEAKAQEDGKSKDDIVKAMADSMRKYADRIERVRNTSEELELWQALANGDITDAEERIEQIQDVPKDRQALLHMKLGKSEKAEELALEIFEDSENQVQPLALTIETLYRNDKKEEARERFDELRTVAGAADLDLPILQRLKPVAETFGYPADWRLKNEKAEDSGERPDLATLGPFRWEPSPAPDWEMTDAKGNALSLKDFKGKPLLMIFYLGAGCLHCIEQLNTFAPYTQKFLNAGISIVAVGVDPVVDLRKTIDQSDQAEGFPFPIVSDAGLKAFKAYRVYDDFESMALHGTFLIDGKSQIRWQDISYEPFEKPEFLLNETKRLLGLPKLDSQLAAIDHEIPASK